MRYIPSRFSLNHLLERPWLFSGIGIDWYCDTIGEYYRDRFKRQLSIQGIEIDPFHIFWIHPDKVRKRTGRKGYNPREDIGTVKGGDWDKNVNKWRYREHSDLVIDLYVSDRFEQSTHYRSLESHFIDGVPWEETELYDIVIGGINNGHKLFHNCRSEEELKNRFDIIDDLYESIKQDGYKTQLEIVKEGGSLHVADFPDMFAKEVTVDIGRDGRLLFVEGRHRLTIAKLLGLEEIPVVILTRHSEWINNLKRGSLPAGHPDTVFDS